MDQTVRTRGLVVLVIIVVAFVLFNELNRLHVEARASYRQCVAEGYDEALCDDVLEP